MQDCQWTLVGLKFPFPMRPRGKVTHPEVATGCAHFRDTLHMYVFWWGAVELKTMMTAVNQSALRSSNICKTEISTFRKSGTQDTNRRFVKEGSFGLNIFPALIRGRATRVGLIMIAAVRIVSLCRHDCKEKIMSDVKWIRVV